MELKPSMNALADYDVKVLIEPLWNWNRACAFLYAEQEVVLIEPLWNWNATLKTMKNDEDTVLIEPLWNWNKN